MRLQLPIAASFKGPASQGDTLKQPQAHHLIPHKPNDQQLAAQQVCVQVAVSAPAATSCQASGVCRMRLRGAAAHAHAATHRTSSSIGAGYTRAVTPCDVGVSCAARLHGAARVPLHQSCHASVHGVASVAAMRAVACAAGRHEALKGRGLDDGFELMEDDDDEEEEAVDEGEMEDEEEDEGEDEVSCALTEHHAGPMLGPPA